MTDEEKPWWVKERGGQEKYTIPRIAEIMRAVRGTKWIYDYFKEKVPSVESEGDSVEEWKISRKVWIENKNAILKTIEEINDKENEIMSTLKDRELSEADGYIILKRKQELDTEKKKFLDVLEELKLGIKYSLDVIECLSNERRMHNWGVSEAEAHKQELELWNEICKVKHEMYMVKDEREYKKKEKEHQRLCTIHHRKFKNIFPEGIK